MRRASSEKIIHLNQGGNVVKKKLALRLLKKKVDSLLVREEKKEKVMEQPPIALMIPEKLLVSQCDGAETCLQSGLFFPIKNKDAKDVMHLDSAVNKPTTAAKVRVYELKRDATFGQMFKHLRNNPRKMCFTEAQICTFIRENKHVLTSCDATFFPFALKSGKVAVLHVTYYPEISEDQFCMYTYPIWNLRPWNTKFKFHLVVMSK